MCLTQHLLYFITDKSCITQGEFVIKLLGTARPLNEIVCHDPLPDEVSRREPGRDDKMSGDPARPTHPCGAAMLGSGLMTAQDRINSVCHERSEEHTSELQSRENLVCRLLLEKKKRNDVSRHSRSNISVQDQNQEK